MLEVFRSGLVLEGRRIEQYSHLALFWCPHRLGPIPEGNHLMKGSHHAPKSAVEPSGIAVMVWLPSMSTMQIASVFAPSGTSTS
jgi:hypothetical protein